MILFFATVTVIVPMIILAGLVIFTVRNRVEHYGHDSGSRGKDRPARSNG